MSPEVQHHTFDRLVEVAHRFGAAVVKRALEPTVVPFEHFPGEDRHFEQRDFPGFKAGVTGANETVDVSAA